MIKRDQKYIESDKIWSKSQNKSTFSIEFHLFDLLIDIEVIFFHLLIKSISNLVEFNHREIEIVIHNVISILKSESSLNHHPNLDGLESQSLMIQFRIPNCLGLQFWFSEHQNPIFDSYILKISILEHLKRKLKHQKVAV